MILVLLLNIITLLFTARFLFFLLLVYNIFLGYLQPEYILFLFLRWIFIFAARIMVGISMCVYLKKRRKNQNRELKQLLLFLHHSLSSSLSLQFPFHGEYFRLFASLLYLPFICLVVFLLSASFLGIRMQRWCYICLFTFSRPHHSLIYLSFK